MLDTFYGHVVHFFFELIMVIANNRASIKTLDIVYKCKL